MTSAKQQPSTQLHRMKQWSKTLSKPRVLQNADFDLSLKEERKQTNTVLYLLFEQIIYFKLLTYLVWQFVGPKKDRLGL